jgi:hypothetical protein
MWDLNKPGPTKYGEDMLLDSQIREPDLDWSKSEEPRITYVQFIKCPFPISSITIVSPAPLTAIFAFG